MILHEFRRRYESIWYPFRHMDKSASITILTNRNLISWPEVISWSSRQEDDAINSLKFKVVQTQVILFLKSMSETERLLNWMMNFSKSIEDDFIQFKSRSLTDPTRSDIDFINKMAWIWTTLKFNSRLTNQFAFGNSFVYPTKRVASKSNKPNSE